MKFSIITVVKNNKKGLLQAIDSVRSQTYKSVEHIIIDGGSTDGTVEMLRSITGDSSLIAQNDNAGTVILNEVKDLHSEEDSSSETQNDNGKMESGMTDHNYQLRTISESDNGIYDAINKGIKMATGDVIGLLHSDDLFADEMVLERYAEAFAQRAESGAQSVEAVYSDLVYVGRSSELGVESSGFGVPGSELNNHSSNLSRRSETKTDLSRRSETKTDLSRRSETKTDQSLNVEIVRYWRTQKKEFTAESQRRRAIRTGWMPPHPTLFLKKEVFEKYGLYRTDMKIAADYEMILRLFYTHKITSYYLLHTTYLMSTGGASNRSIKNIMQKSKEDLRALKLHKMRFPLLTLFLKNVRKVPQFF